MVMINISVFLWQFTTYIKSTLNITAFYKWPFNIIFLLYLINQYLLSLNPAPKFLNKNEVKIHYIYIYIYIYIKNLIN